MDDTRTNAVTEAAVNSGQPSVTVSLREVIELLALVVAAPVTLVTAWLIYFGKMRAAATFAYFGLDLSVLDLSSQDYIDRSSTAAIRPAAVFLFIGAATLMILTGLSHLLEHGSRKQLLFARTLATVTATVMMTLGVAGLFSYWFGGSGLFAPFCPGGRCSRLRLRGRPQR